MNDNPDRSPYRMVGIPDGLGAYDNHGGTFTVLMNHELREVAGVPRAHGGIGAFVSIDIAHKHKIRFLIVHIDYGLEREIQRTPGLVAGKGRKRERCQ
ncbi:MAG: hypothetical protein M3461_06675 [Pseudomonadota bacterium]|nr:hypothetical protein [Pseudomonadota bacterium]